MDGTEPPGVLSALREKAAAATGHRPESGLPCDLRQRRLAASGNWLYGEMPAQAAQAAGDDRLLERASECHPWTLRRTRWTSTMIRTPPPQVPTAL